MNDDTNQPLKLKGPYEVQIVVHLINEEDDTAKASVGVSMGDLPAQADIGRAVAIVEQELAKKGFRLMNKEEFFNQMMVERCGATEHFVCPGSEEWDS